MSDSYPPTPEEARAEAKRGEKLWREFNRVESVRRSLPLVLAAFLILGAIVAFLIAYNSGR